MAKRHRFVSDALSQVEPIGLPKFVKLTSGSPTTLPICDIATVRWGTFETLATVSRSKPSSSIHLNENSKLGVSTLRHSPFLFLRRAYLGTVKANPPPEGMPTWPPGQSCKPKPFRFLRDLKDETRDFLGKETLFFDLL